MTLHFLLEMNGKGGEFPIAMLVYERVIRIPSSCTPLKPNMAGNGKSACLIGDTSSNGVFFCSILMSVFPGGHSDPRNLQQDPLNGPLNLGI